VSLCFPQSTVFTTPMEFNRSRALASDLHLVEDWKNRHGSVNRHSFRALLRNNILCMEINFVRWTTASDQLVLVGAAPLLHGPLVRQNDLIPASEQIVAKIDECMAAKHSPFAEAILLNISQKPINHIADQDMQSSSRKRSTRSTQPRPSV
jgi:hypothetical protein